MIAADPVAALGVYRGGDAVALGQLARARLPPRCNDERAGNPVLRVEHAQLRAAIPGGERSGVADLTSGLGVERRAVEDDVDLRALARLGEPLATADEREDFGAVVSYSWRPVNSVSP